MRTALFSVLVVLVAALAGCTSNEGNPEWRDPVADPVQQGNETEPQQFNQTPEPEPFEDPYKDQADKHPGNYTPEEQENRTDPANVPRPEGLQAIIEVFNITRIPNAASFNLSVINPSEAWVYWRVDFSDNQGQREGGGDELPLNFTRGFPYEGGDFSATFTVWTDYEFSNSTIDFTVPAGPSYDELCPTDEDATQDPITSRYTGSDGKVYRETNGVNGLQPRFLGPNCPQPDDEADYERI